MQKAVEIQKTHSLVEEITEGPWEVPFSVRESIKAHRTFCGWSVSCEWASSAFIGEE